MTELAAPRSILLVILIGLLGGACGSHTVALGQDPKEDPLSVSTDGVHTVNGAAVLDLERVTEQVRRLYLDKDPAVDFVDLTAKYMTVKEYSENVDTVRVPDGLTFEEWLPNEEVIGEDLLVVIGFKTHYRVERLGVHPFDPSDDTPESDTGYLSPSDGMMGVIHAIFARTNAEHATLLYTPREGRDYVANLMAFTPAPYLSATPPIPIPSTPSP